jgi:excisionase family DNA binding protein
LLIMPEPTRGRIRRIFLNRGPNFALITAAELLGITMNELKRDIDDGAIVAVSTGVGVRIPKEELIAAAMRVWEQAVIEAALGEDAARVLPEAIRLVLLRVRVPRYQRDMLVALAKRHGTTVDDVVMRELEDVACAHAEELAAVVPALAAALAWPAQA